MLWFILSLLVDLGTSSSLAWRRFWLTCTSLCAGSRDEFFLAPEYQEHGIVTEKVGFSYFHLERFILLILCSVSCLSVLSCVTSGLRLRRCCDSLGYGQVPVVT